MPRLISVPLCEEASFIRLVSRVMWCNEVYNTCTCTGICFSMQRYLFAAIGNGFKVYDVLTYEGKYLLHTHFH